MGKAGLYLGLRFDVSIKTKQKDKTRTVLQHCCFISGNETKAIVYILSKKDLIIENRVFQNDWHFHRKGRHWLVSNSRAQY